MTRAHNRRKRPLRDHAARIRTTLKQQPRGPYPCCRHCSPTNEHHPAQPDTHSTPCGSGCYEAEE